MNIKSTVTAFVALVMFSIPAAGFAQTTDKSLTLLQELRDADEAGARRLEKEIRLEWSKSGSAAMDLLLKRGRDALEIQQVDVAIEHFTALTDHAPDFAEGWHGLAMAYFQEERLGLTVDALEHVLALNPQHFGALRGLGAVFESLEKPALAHDAYSRVLDIRPHDADVIEALERLDLQVNGTAL
ncbi:tetratricopeptide repeat protein [Puniceibacterium sp. IMCC21224]|uniref:tetratricopeptide repeat protein n=1 Tax=Puniceibacterium sp. IMCC21224 TaxID=1618204 RepID=UPI00065CF6FE|nr:tetratricopeptide repeat protein [Puniceibacterium sp. IMCC21224]KMK67790.1 tetratricopeptide repeat protein [Puniceibacterium sp. IMCC21224]